MTQADEEEDRGPQKPSLPVKNTERDERKEESLRDPLVDTSEQRVSYVTSVELTYRQQV